MQNVTAHVDFNTIMEGGIVYLADAFTQIARDQIPVPAQVNAIHATESKIAVIVALLHDLQAHHIGVAACRALGQRHIHRIGKTVEAYQRNLLAHPSRVIHFHLFVLTQDMSKVEGLFVSSAGINDIVLADFQYVERLGRELNRCIAFLSPIGFKLGIVRSFLAWVSRRVSSCASTTGSGRSSGVSSQA